MSYCLLLIVAIVSVGDGVAVDEVKEFFDDITAKSPFVIFPDEEVWKVQIGDICQLSRLPLPHNEPDKFLECLQVNKSKEEWPWTGKGLWVLKECNNGTEFYPITHSCASKKYIRRQQSMCQNSNPPPSFCAQPSAQPIVIQPVQQQMQCQCPPQVQSCACPQPQAPMIQPTAMPQSGFGQFCQQQPQNAACQCMPSAQQNNCPPPCPPQQNNCPPPPPSCQPAPTQCQMPPQPCPLASGGSNNAQVGGICSWMLAPLAADPSTPKNYLQCQPAQGNFLCGRWVCLPCPPATIFDVSAQVCVNDPNNMPAPIMNNNQGGNSNCACGCQSGTSIGQCNSQNQCPGQSSCQAAVPMQQPYNNFNNFGSGSGSNSNCQQACNSQPVCCYGGGGSGKKK